MNQMELKNSEEELIKPDLIKRLLDLTTIELNKYFDGYSYSQILDSFSIDIIEKKIKKAEKERIRVGDIIFDTFIDSSFLVVGVYERSYQCLDSKLNVVTYGVNAENIIKVRHSSLFDAAIGGLEKVEKEWDVKKYEI